MSNAEPGAGPTPGADRRPASAGPCGCQEAIDRLFEYVDAEMPLTDTVRVAAHLAVCDSCEDAAGAERHVRDVLRRSCHEMAPEALRTRVVSALSVRRVRGSLTAD